MNRFKNLSNKIWLYTLNPWIRVEHGKRRARQAMMLLGIASVGARR